jgi:hypothetical protein
MPIDPDMVPDPIQTMDFGTAQTIEEIVQFVHDHRNGALWDMLRLPVAGRPTGPMQ